MKNTGNREIDDLQRRYQELSVQNSSVFAAIGKSFYDQNCNNPAPEYAAQFASIKEAAEQMKQIDTRIKFLNGIVVCSKCNLENSVNSSFCAGCGTRLPHRTFSDGANRCPNCGNMIAQGQRFCGTCGAQVPQAQEAPAPQVAPQPAPQVAPQPVPQGAAMPIPEEIPAPNVTPATPAERRCPKCNALIVEDDSVFCAECGEKLV